jgi:translation initiation factor IF-2
MFLVPLIIAINKVDKMTNRTSIESLKLRLQEHGVFLEEFGGDTQIVEISALKVTFFSIENSYYLFHLNKGI